MGLYNLLLRVLYTHVSVSAMSDTEVKSFEYDFRASREIVWLFRTALEIFFTP